MDVSVPFAVTRISLVKESEIRDGRTEKMLSERGESHSELDYEHVRTYIFGGYLEAELYLVYEA